MTDVDGTLNPGSPMSLMGSIEAARAQEIRDLWVNAGGGMDTDARGQLLNPQAPGGPHPPGMIDTGV